MLADVMPVEDVSWSRLVSAIVLLGLSLAIGYRTGYAPPPRAVPLPVPERIVAVVDLPPLAPVVVDALAPLADVPAPVEPAALQPAAHADRIRPGEPHQIARASHPSAGRAMRPRPHRVMHAASQLRPVRPSVRTRAQVRAEYLRSRDVVAALTGEDSGSAYLARVAARQRAARTQGTSHRRG